MEREEFALITEKSTGKREKTIIHYQELMIC
jgi:hypothetical protein